jgi:murein DD-endopeptidase MepM/ murein hydrolase activator NlpD
VCHVGLATAALVLLAASAAAQKPKPASPPAGAAGERVHLVAQGDTLGGVARRYRVAVSTLVAANRLRSERAVLRVGQRLIIPATSNAAPPSTAGTTPSPGTKAAPARAAAPVARTAAATARRPTDGAPRATTPRTARGPRGLELAVPDFVEIAPPFLWPVEGPVSSTYGRRRSGWHRGIDIKADAGNVIFAAAGGMVVASGSEPRYGRVVKIEHEDGFLTVYAHNEENLVTIGMRVSAGDPIGTIGRTGRATAHHLHFEIRRGASVYNPLYLLPLPARVGQVDLVEEPEEEHE